MGESSVVLRIYSKCNEADKNSVRRELNRQIKLLFDRENIQIPFPQLVIYDGDKELSKNTEKEEEQSDI